MIDIVQVKLSLREPRYPNDPVLAEAEVQVAYSDWVESYTGESHYRDDLGFTLRGFRIIQRKNGKVFIAPPSKRLPNGTYALVVDFSNAATRMIFEGAIMDEWTKLKYEQKELV